MDFFTRAFHGDSRRGSIGEEKLKPKDVFKPAGVPVGASSIYVQRQKEQEALDYVLDSESCPVVYGDYGVGKTTLVHWYYQKFFETNEIIYVPSAEGYTLERLFEEILEYLGYEIQESRTQGRETQAGLSAGVNLFAVKAGSSGGVKDTSSRTSSLAVQSPTDRKMLQLIGDMETPIVIDEMHKASVDFRKEVAGLIKNTRTYKSPSGQVCQVVLIGTTMDATYLAEADPGISRYIESVRVGSMTYEESVALIERGFETLNYKISESTINWVARLSGGAPFILQRLCLDAANDAKQKFCEDSNIEVTDNNFRFAIRRYIEVTGHRMESTYVRAVENQGVKRYRKQILHTMALLDGEYAYMEDLVGGVSEQLGESVPPQSLSGPLRQLKSEEFGKVLKDIQRPTEGQMQNVSVFSDPMMKSYIRFRMGIDDEVFG